MNLLNLRRRQPVSDAAETFPKFLKLFVFGPLDLGFLIHIMSLPVIPVIRRENTMKKQLTLLFALILTFPLVTALFAQEASKETRFEGRVQRSSKEQSSLTIRQEGGTLEMTCVYDSSTKWVSQRHGDKKINDIDTSQVKDGDYVICKGTPGERREIHATLISKRLSHQ
jgi:hypothetical protein